MASIVLRIGLLNLITPMRDKHKVDTRNRGFTEGGEEPAGPSESECVAAVVRSDDGEELIRVGNVGVRGTGTGSGLTLDEGISGGVLRG